MFFVANLPDLLPYAKSDFVVLIPSTVSIFVEPKKLIFFKFTFLGFFLLVRCLMFSGGGTINLTGGSFGGISSMICFWIGGCFCMGVMVCLVGCLGLRGEAILNTGTLFNLCFCPGLVVCVGFSLGL